VFAFPISLRHLTNCIFSQDTGRHAFSDSSILFIYIVHCDSGTRATFQSQTKLLTADEITRRATYRRSRVLCSVSTCDGFGVSGRAVAKPSSSPRIFLLPPPSAPHPGIVTASRVGVGRRRRFEIPGRGNGGSVAGTSTRDKRPATILPRGRPAWATRSISAGGDGGGGTGAEAGRRDAARKPPRSLASRRCSPTGPRPVRAYADLRVHLELLLSRLASRPLRAHEEQRLLEWIRGYVVTWLRG
jgi:hypothetical protein